MQAKASYYLASGQAVIGTKRCDRRAWLCTVGGRMNSEVHLERLVKGDWVKP